MAELNIELLEKTMQHIETHPEDWNQETWRCGTGMCFAGHAATLAGREWASENPDGDNSMMILAKPDEFDSASFEETYSHKTGRWTTTDRKVVLVEDVARSELGLAEDEAEIMFEPDNTKADLRKMVDNLKAGREILEPERDDDKDY